MAEPEPVNRAAFEALVEEMGDDPAFVADLVDSYVDNARQLVEGMHEAVRKGEPADLVRLDPKAVHARTNLAHAALVLGRPLPPDVAAAPVSPPDLQKQPTATP